MLSIKALIPTIIALGASVTASPVADPLAFAEAAGIPVAAEASYSCHASCGYLIIAARACTPDGASDGGYDSSCLCASGSEFMGYVNDCLSCGWCLWDDYGKYLTSPLGLCDLSTDPTGTECLSSTAAATTTSSTPAATTTSTTPAATTTSTTSAATTTSTTPAVATTSSTSTAGESSTATVQTFTGAAGKVAMGAGAGIVGLAALLI